MKRYTRRLLSILTALLMMLCPVLQGLAEAALADETAPAAGAAMTEVPADEQAAGADEEPTPAEGVTEAPAPEPIAGPAAGPAPEPTAEPVVTEAPAPNPTEVPAPEVTEEPAATEAPAVTEQPTAEPTEGPVPEKTEGPVITEEPVVTEAPAVTGEPTVTAAPEETEEPTAKPTEEPAPEVTEEPAVTQAPAATEAPVVTEEPTAELTPAPVVNSLADDPAFTRGYIYLLSTAKGFDKATGSQYKLTIAGGEAGYALSRPNPEGKTDRLEVAFNMDGEEVRFYVDADELMYYADEVLTAKLADWEKNSKAIFLGGNEAMPLLPIHYTLVETEPEATAAPESPEATEAPAEKPVTTEEPTKEPETPKATETPAEKPEGTEEPSKEPVTPEATEAPAEKPEGTEEPESPEVTEAPAEKPVTTEEPSKEPETPEATETPNPTEEPEPPQTLHDLPAPLTPKGQPRYDLTDYANQPLFLSHTPNYQVVYEETVGGGAALPQSASPYPASRDDVYILNGTATAARMTIRFSSDTMLEEGYDLLLVYDAQGYYQAGFTGGEAAGMTVNVPGNRVYIRLLSDDSISHVGFRVAGASCYDTSELTQLYTDGLGNVTVKWYKPKGTQSFQLQRAEVDPATGRIGPWTTLVQGTGATSHKDTTAEENTYYAYRLRVYSEIQGQKYYAKFHTLKVYNFAAAQITGSEALAGDPAQIRLTWQPVQNGSRYEVLRAETSGGPYAVVGETAASAYTDTPPEMKTYYYKVKAYATVAGAEHPTYGGTPVAIGFPAPPEGLRLEGGPDGAAELRWDACAGAKGYIVYRSSDRDGGYKRQAAVQTCAYTDTAVPAGQQVWYKVRTYRSEGGRTVYSGYSDPVTMVTLSAPAVTGARTSKTSARLTWQPVDGAQGYRIHYGADPMKPLTLLAETTETVYDAQNLTPGTEYACFTVTAFRTDEGLTSLAPSDMVQVQVDPVVYRAVLIGQTYEKVSGITTLYGPANDIAAMRSMLSRMTATPFAVYSAKNLTGQGLLDKFGNVLRYADSNDITLLYYSGHGAKGGYLIGTDGMGVSPALLRATLDRYQGKKLLILDCCYSGKVIGRSYVPFTAADTRSLQRELSGFNAGITGAFAAQSRADDDLAASGYYVITACRSTEQSYENWTSTMPSHGVFTRALTFGSGWNVQTGSATSSLFADASRDGLITLSELYNYALKRVELLGYGHMQHAQAYPSGSAQVMFGMAQ